VYVSLDRCAFLTRNARPGISGTRGHSALCRVGEESSSASGHAWMESSAIQVAKDLTPKIKHAQRTWVSSLSSKQSVVWKCWHSKNFQVFSSLGRVIQKFSFISRPSKGFFT